MKNLSCGKRSFVYARKTILWIVLMAAVILSKSRCTVGLHDQVPRYSFSHFVSQLHVVGFNLKASRW